MTLTALVLALGVCAVLGALASRFARSLPPAVAVRVLVGSSLVAAASTGFAASTLAVAAIGQLPDVAARGGWRPAVLHTDGGLLPGAGVALAALLGAIVLLASTALVRSVGRALRASRDARGLPRLVPRVGVLDDDRPVAFAVGGAGGSVVVSTGLLGALDTTDRSAVLEHELAHLRHRHLAWVTAARLAAWTNPLLRTVPAAVAFATERWADEDAGARLGSRPVVAAALARSALLTAGHTLRPGSATVGVDGGVVTERVASLLRPAPRPRRVVAGAVLALALVGIGSAVVAGTVTDSTFEHAEVVPD
jgi:Zn-dependent protease with chaperone function